MASEHEAAMSADAMRIIRDLSAEREEAIAALRDARTVVFELQSRGGIAGVNPSHPLSWNQLRPLQGRIDDLLEICDD